MIRLVIYLFQIFDSEVCDTGLFSILVVYQKKWKKSHNEAIVVLFPYKWVSLFDA